MNRRSFLKVLGIGTAAAAITPAMLEGFVADPERLLWTPGQRTFILPPEKTFSLYNADDLRALERAMGVIRFYDDRGRLRLDAFNANSPHEVDKLKTLSDQEIRMAVETGYYLDPNASVRRGGVYDPRVSERGGTMYTDRGHMVTGPHRVTASAIRGPLHPMGPLHPIIHRHGQSLLTASGDRYSHVVTTEQTDLGLVVVGHRDRKGP